MLNKLLETSPERFQVALVRIRVSPGGWGREEPPYWEYPRNVLVTIEISFHTTPSSVYPFYYCTDMDKKE
jgi:hypothetical protein